MSHGQSVSSEVTQCDQDILRFPQYWPLISEVKLRFMFFVRISLKSYISYSDPIEIRLWVHHQVQQPEKNEGVSLGPDVRPGPFRNVTGVVLDTESLSSKQRQSPDSSVCGQISNDLPWKDMESVHDRFYMILLYFILLLEVLRKNAVLNAIQCNASW